MESVWWVFGQLFTKGLVYRGFKVMPFSTALATPLSNFEANQEFADTKDPWCVVNFPVTGEENTFFLAWTTTPWTLPSNLALCVNPTMVYVKVKDAAKGCFYYVMKARVAGKSGCLYTEKEKAKKAYEVVEELVGSALVGKKYEPLFDYFVPTFKDTAWRVISDDYVTADSGVGIVHQAPAFGEDDYRVCLREGIFDLQTTGVPCPVNDSGKFTDEVTDYAGQYIKDADKEILQALGARGRLVQKGNLTHRDAFCWRSGTRLVRKAVDSWFVKVTDLDLVGSNNDTHWVPSFVKEKRFHNWLVGARDWNISRNRYWGTPIPLWVSEDYEEIVCISSIAQLEELSGVTGITDLHRESIDHITIPSKQGKGTLKRIKQVFDCWFESGSMPYASRHYPFEQKERFDNTFPADFIAEGIDQTRGWFYTLTVLGTALFGRSPFKNLIVNGLVLAKDGKKMSKSKKNYPDPTIVIDQFGSDALRCYLINSPVVRAEDLRFNDKDIQIVLKDLFLPWLNSMRFFKQCAETMTAKAGGKTWMFDDTKICPSTNVTDRWVLAFAQETVKFVHQEMQAYRLYTVVPRVFGFVEQLTNWYIRFNRKRLKGDAGPEEANNAMWALGEVLYTQSRMMAPFAPFFSEYSYQQIKMHISSAAAAEAGTLPVAPSAWDAAAVAAWANSLSEKSGDFGKAFADNGITGADLLDVDHADLTSMGFAKCHDRKVVLREAKKLAEAEEAASMGASPEEYKSIHFQMVPQPNALYEDSAIVRAFDVMKVVINSGRIIRDRATMPVKYPLKQLVIISKDAQKLEDATTLQTYIEDELNIQTFTTTSDETQFNIKILAEPNQRALGKRLGRDAKAVFAAIRAMDDAQVTEYRDTEKIVLAGVELSGDDISLGYQVGESNDGSVYVANVDQADPQLIVLLDCAPTPEMLMEGTAREICSNVQKSRKTAKLTPKDKIQIFLTVDTDDEGTKLAEVLTQYAGKIGDDLKSSVSIEAYAGDDALLTETKVIGKKGAKITITLIKA